MVALRPLGFCLCVSEQSLTARALPAAKGGGGVLSGQRVESGNVLMLLGRVERNRLESGMKMSAWEGPRGPGHVAVGESPGRDGRLLLS